MRLKIIIVGSIFLFFINCGYCNPSTSQVDSLQSKIKLLENDIQNIDIKQNIQSEQLQNYKDLVNTSYNGTSQQIGSSTNTITIFTIIYGLIGILVSFYVTKLERNTRRLTNENIELQEWILKTKEEVETLSTKISSDITGLYKQIRNEESNQMLERLQYVPEDITNLFKPLTSRDLEKEHYDQMKDAFLKLKLDHINYQKYSGIYLILFFQHFSDLAFFDEELKDDLINELQICLTNAFLNDVNKSIYGFFKTILSKKISNSSDVIHHYLLSLINSKFGNNEIIFFTINDVMRTRENRFELYNAISKEEDYLIFRKNFGKLIIDYNYENLNPEEEMIIDDIKNILEV